MHYRSTKKQNTDGLIQWLNKSCSAPSPRNNFHLRIVYNNETMANLKNFNDQLNALKNVSCGSKALQNIISYSEVPEKHKEIAIKHGKLMLNDIKTSHYINS